MKVQRPSKRDTNTVGGEPKYFPCDVYAHYRRGDHRFLELDRAG
ncbi:MAG TPA: hypothetical protein VGK19_20985 [Capsulimonadaceae bacterium]